MQDEFHQILENLEESIIIMSDFEAEFMNKRFLYNFSGGLFDRIPSKVEELKEIATPSKL